MGEGDMLIRKSFITQSSRASAKFPWAPHFCEASFSLLCLLRVASSENTQLELCLCYRVERSSAPGNEKVNGKRDPSGNVDETRFSRNNLGKRENNG